jgi:3-hydroxymyristoyl/3-hydroxydecanoyl-(acyl carrier protein) dehydratase
MDRLGSKFGRGKAVATVNGDVACEAMLSFIIAPESALR